MEGALTTDMMATDLADYLVRKGVRNPPFPPPSSTLNALPADNFLF